PRGRHPPPEHLLALRLGEHEGREAGAGGSHAGLLEEITTLHHGPPRSLRFVERAKYNARSGRGRRNPRPLPTEPRRHGPRAASALLLVVGRRLGLGVRLQPPRLLGGLREEVL